MRFTRRPSERDVSEEFTQHQQQEQEQDDGHDDDVMADARADVKPTAVIAHQEEKVLQRRTRMFFHHA